MASDVKLIRDRDGVLRFDYGEPPAPAARPSQGQQTPVMQVPKLVLDDSVAKGDAASAKLWGDVFAQVNSLFGTPEAQAPSARQAPADIVKQAMGKEPWFVSAEMVIPRGGRKSGVRAAVLEVTVKKDGLDAARESLSKLELDCGTSLVSQRPIPSGRGYTDGRRR